MKPQKSHTKPEPVRSRSVISGHPDNSRLSGPGMTTPTALKENGTDNMLLRTSQCEPVTPKTFGNVSSSTVISPKVRRNDKIADSFPFDNAVNVAEVKMFSPQNRKLNGKIKNPFRAIS